MTLTLKLALTFGASFTGAKNMYGYAEDSTGLNSGWQTLGTWTAYTSSGPPPAVVSVSPNSGTGATQTFLFVFSDANGYASLPVTEMLFGASTSYLSSCVVYYNQPGNGLYLANDQATGWLGPISPGSGTLQNSKCTVTGVGSSVIRIGLDPDDESGADLPIDIHRHEEHLRVC